MTDRGGHGQATISGVARRERGGGERSMVPPGEPRSYYGEPVIAEPVWTPEIPLYFFAGGIAGAAAPLALLARSAGNETLARRAAAVALAGAVVSPPLLISDLGKPSRFLYMLRVFKVTSPMSVGSWILSAFGATATASAAYELFGVLPRVGRSAEAANLVLGPLLATYTATLVADTAVPVWHAARRELPFVFGASAVGTAGALTALVTPSASAVPAWRMAAGGAAAELAFISAMERRLDWLGEPYHEGRPGMLARAAKAFTVAGVALIGAGTVGPRLRRAGEGAGHHPLMRRARGPLRRVSRRTEPDPAWRRAAQAGAGAVLAGGLLERWAVFRAGFASAADPRYTVGPQRERAGAGPDGGASVDPV